MRRVRSGGAACPRCHEAPIDEPAYAYLLGLYLGDGWISRERRTYRLRIVQDMRYRDLIRLTQRTMQRVRGGCGRAGTATKIGCIEIYASWNHWPCLFPQHGTGRKHLRPIPLEEWQERIVGRYPRQLLRGLIHSDGCRTINRVQNGRYAYPRYFFDNNSADIQQIFRDTCDALGIHCRNSKATTISIARRHDVAMLDAFVGPKS